MIFCFGISWPLSIVKSWKSRTAKGKSLYFELFIWVGYVFGIVRKFMLWNGTQDWVFILGWVFYFFNLTAISIDMLLYFRNVRLDRLAAERQE